MLLSVRNKVLTKTLFDLLGFIVSYADDIFPNLRIPLKIEAYLVVSVCINETGSSQGSCSFRKRNIENRFQ